MNQKPLAPNRLRWDRPKDLPEGKDFVDGMVTMLTNRDPANRHALISPHRIFYGRLEQCSRVQVLSSVRGV